jgi:ABC-type uncharacterized transport system substrate-binding protein
VVIPNVKRGGGGFRRARRSLLHVAVAEDRVRRWNPAHRHECSQVGYREQDVEILEGRVTRGDRTGARAAVDGFIQQRAAVLFVIGSELARLARERSSELPIVFITPGDPVAAGMVPSLARPGGHMTAITFEYPELSGKRLELLQEMLPQLRRVLVLYDPRDASPRQSVAAAQEAAARLGITLVEREVRSREEIMHGLAALDEADVLLGIPGGLPVERPMKLELVINLKTAQSLGLIIPPTLLYQADEVIR